MTTLFSDIETIQDQLKQYLHNLEHHVQVERQGSASVVNDAIQRIEQLEAQLEEAHGAIRDILKASFTTYKAKNGRECGIEDDSGEMCYIVPHEQIIFAEKIVNAMKGGA